MPIVLLQFQRVQVLCAGGRPKQGRIVRVEMKNGRIRKRAHDAAVEEQVAHRQRDTRALTEQAMLVHVLTVAVSPIMVMLLEMGFQRGVMLRRRTVLMRTHAGGVRMDLGPGNARGHDRHRKQYGERTARARATGSHGVSVPQG